MKVGITLMLVLAGLELCSVSCEGPKRGVVFDIVPLLLLMGVDLVVQLCERWSGDNGL